MFCPKKLLGRKVLRTLENLKKDKVFPSFNEEIKLLRTYGAVKKLRQEFFQKIAPGGGGGLTSESKNS